jgi:NADH dehydrogenase
MNDFVRGARRFYPRIAPDEIKMVLIHSGSRILPEVNKRLSGYALAKLRERGVSVLLETRVARCSDGVVELSDGSHLSAATFVWAAGTSPSPILDQLALPRLRNGKLQVDASMAVKDHAGIWAVGDSAAIPDLNSDSGGFCPPTAQFALRQGKILAANIAASLDGGPATPFRFKSLGMLAGLGRRCAVAEIMGWQFSGFFAWWLWRTIYLLKLPGFERKLRVALDWTLDLFFPRDIVYLRPLHNARGPGSVTLSLPDEPACPIPDRPGSVLVDLPVTIAN